MICYFDKLFPQIVSNFLTTRKKISLFIYRERKKMGQIQCCRKKPDLSNLKEFHLSCFCNALYQRHNQKKTFRWKFLDYMRATLILLLLLPLRQKAFLISPSRRVFSNCTYSQCRIGLYKIIQKVCPSSMRASSTIITFCVNRIVYYI